MRPPPSTTSPSYRTTAWPGETARCGRANSTWILAGSIWRDTRLDRCGVRANLGLAVERRIRPFSADKRDLRGIQRAAIKRLLRADDHRVARGIQRRDIQRLLGGDAKAAALADRVERQALVPAKLAALHDRRSGRGAGCRRAPRAAGCGNRRPAQSRYPGSRAGRRWLARARRPWRAPPAWRTRRSGTSAAPDRPAEAYAACRIGLCRYRARAAADSRRRTTDDGRLAIDALIVYSSSFVVRLVVGCGHNGRSRRNRSPAHRRG